MTTTVSHHTVYQPTILGPTFEPHVQNNSTARADLVDINSGPALKYLTEVIRNHVDDSVLPDDDRELAGKVEWWVREGRLQ